MAFRNLKLSMSEGLLNLLNWVTFLLGVAGGFAATGTFIGRTIGHVIHGLPLYINLPIAFGAAVMALYDIADDGVPNRLRTIYIAVLWPSWLLGAQGKGAHVVNGWIAHMNAKIDKSVGPWVMDHPGGHNTAIAMTTIAVILIVLALYHAHRYYPGKKRSTGTATTVGATTTTTSSPVVATRKKR